MRYDNSVIRVERAREKITQVELADKTGINRKQIGIYEEDIGKCSIDNLIKIATALKFDPKKIFLDS